jgi:hypothetical protein
MTIPSITRVAIVATLVASLLVAAPTADSNEPPAAALREIPVELPAQATASAAERWVVSEVVPAGDAALVGADWGGEVSLEAELRVERDGAWEPWVDLELAGEDDGPDPGTEEAEYAASYTASEPVWVGRVDRMQVRVRGPEVPDEVTLHTVDLDGSDELAFDPTAPPPGSADAATRPSIVPRSSWDPNNDCRPRSSPSYASNVRFAVVHHTAGSNSYTSSQAANIVRSICLYHRNTNGWNDIGYNIVVDRFGRTYEGRAGGLHRAVIGAHAANYNTGSTGIAVLGCFNSTGGCSGDTAIPRAARDAVDRALAWKFDIHNVDPHGTTSINSRRIPNIVGHRDVGSTACPGNRFYEFVRGSNPMAPRVAALMGPFADVPPNHTFVNDIVWIADRGITRGCNPPTNDRFCPGHAVSRAQMAAFLVRAMGLTDDRHPGFKDVPAGSTYDRDIRRLARAGITQGCNPPANDRFCPSDSVTREQMAAFMVRARGYTDDRHPGFTDVRAGSTFERDIKRLAKAGVTRGCNPPDNTRFCPRDPVTRAQMAAFLRRAFQ